ncbi:MAG: tetratricopeptide repeat protein [Candidatus Sumerlaeia bacterium]
MRKKRSPRLCCWKYWIAAVCLLLMLQGQAWNGREARAQSNYTFHDYSLLLDNGRLLYWCGLYDYADPTYSKALELSASAKEINARLRLMSEAVVYYCKTGQGAQTNNYASQIRNQLNTTQDALTRFYGFYAMGYNYLYKNSTATAETMAQNATNIARQLGREDLEGQSCLLASKAFLQRNQNSQALDMVQKAINLFKQNKRPLEEAEAYHHQASCYLQIGDGKAAQLARQKAVNTVTSTGSAPLLNYTQTARQIAELQKEHILVASMGNYEKARNDALSLLILINNQFKAPGLDAAVRNNRVSEPVLLAYMGYYSVLSGHWLAAPIYSDLAHKKINQENDAAKKVEYRLVQTRLARLFGKPRESINHLESADQSLQRLSNPSTDIQLGIEEEKGLAFFLLGYREQALQQFEKALPLAEETASPQNVNRVRFYLDRLKGGELEAALLTDHPRELEAAIRQFLRSQIGTETAEIFKSPVVQDYSIDAVEPAARQVNAISLGRPELKVLTDNDYVVFMSTRRWEKAIPIIETVIAENGATVERLLKLGECHLNLANWEKAKDAYERALEIEPGNRRAMEYLKTVNFRLNR